MKAMGIVRRIDELGRVVIPKEIRRTLHIRDGEPLEIYTTAEGEVVFKKYSPMLDISPFAGQYAEILYKNSGHPVMISDRDHIIAVGGLSTRDFIHRKISYNAAQKMHSRKLFAKAKTADSGSFEPCEGTTKQTRVAAPILTSGDVVGSVMFVDDGPATDTDVKLASVAAAFLGKQLDN